MKQEKPKIVERKEEKKLNKRLKKNLKILMSMEFLLRFQ